jgi:tetratricopeptide (TPR) repeat protein
MTEASALEQGERRRLLGLLLAGYASTRQRQGKFEEAIDHARRAAAEAEAAGDLATLAHLYHMLDRLHTLTGDRATALEFRDAALPLFAQVGDLASQGTVLHDLAADAQSGGRLDEAAWLFERAVDARTRAGDVVRAADSINSLGEIEMARGRFESAQEHFAEALRVWRGARALEGVALAALNLARLNLDAGQPEIALEAAEEAVALAEEIGAEHLQARAALVSAAVYARLQRWVEAWESATRALPTAAPEDGRRLRLIRAEALEGTGGRRRAEMERQMAAASDSAPTTEGPAPAEPGR